MKIYQIDCSARKEGSTSRMLAKKILDKVKKDKSEDRPINNLQDRIFMLQSIKYIDKVFVFSSKEGLEDKIEEAFSKLKSLI